MCTLNSGGVITNEREKMRTIYTQDWSTEQHGWTAAASCAKAPSVPTRINVAHPLAEYAIMFAGNGGWAIAAKEPPLTSGVLEIGFRAYVCSSGRNSLSLNVRDKRGGAIFKFSFGERGAILANRQPRPTGEDQPSITTLRYTCHRPYELIARHVIGSRKFTLTLLDLITGEFSEDQTVWACSSSTPPSMLDFDQEGSGAVAYLGKVEVVEP